MWTRVAKVRVENTRVTTVVRVRTSRIASHEWIALHWMTKAPVTTFQRRTKKRKSPRKRTMIRRLMSTTTVSKGKNWNSKIASPP
jgi:hypothetical protein